MKEPRGIKTRRILNALLAGKVLTPFDANDIAKTNEGTRSIRKLRENLPILDVQVAGELYHKYWLSRDYINAWREGRLVLVRNGVEINPHMPL